MKTHLLHACAFLALSVPATAEIIGVEQFDYSDGAIAGQSGGTFWDFGNITAPVHDGTPSLWQNIVGTPAIASGRLVTNDNSALRPHNGPTLGFGSDEENGSVTDGNRVQQVVYHRVTFTTGATVPAFLGLSTYDFGAERIFFGKRTGQTVFGIETFNGFGAMNSTTAANVQANTTYTLVAKVDYGNDRLSLWINPTLGGTEPTANAVITSYTTNNFSTGVRLGSGSGGAVTWDNLVSATTWADLGTVVTTTADEDNGSLGGGTGVSLREAVKYSASGTLITFAPGLSGQTITLGGTQMDLPAGRSLTVDASALPNGLTLDGNYASRHFNVDQGESLTLRGLTLTRGFSNGNGGAVQSAGRLLAVGCTFVDNATIDGDRGGGGVCNTGGGAMTLQHCTFTGNSAPYGGGHFHFRPISQ